MYKRVSATLHLLLLVILLGMCGSSIYFVNAGADEMSAAAITRVPTRAVSPTIAASPEAGWTQLGPGLDRRVVPVYDELNNQVESVYIWRLDQAHFQMDVAYSGTPKSLEAWQSETNAMMVVNGGYYSVENDWYSPDGLTIMNGESYGRSFIGFGGMLAIDDSRTDLRWLVDQPYSPGESLRAALQSFPILVQPGGELGFGPERENNVRARRTVLGQDQYGRILLIVAPLGHFTLHELSVFLTESDLNLDIAVNLDGGGSTGILVAVPREVIPPTRALPFVILVYAR